MADIRYINVGIKAVSACVPSGIERNIDLGYLLSESDIRKSIDNVGISERRIASDQICASDLCFEAAKKLILDNQVEKSSIDALIFVSQTPDYHQPVTSAILQNRLGLDKSTLCFDISMACSGFIYGLSTAFSYASQQGCDRVLLLVGETMSKIVSDYDKESKPLFGDAGTATLIEKGDYGESVFSLNSDGSGYDIMMIPSGGYRNQCSPKSFELKTDANGNSRNDCQFRMDGMSVFNFGMREEPKDIKHILSIANLTVEDLDLIIFHQANKFMTDFFAKKLKIDSSKVPYSLYKYGNTSSASIPLTIVSELKNGYHERESVILSGFGAGLSWGSALLNLSKCYISEIIEL